MLDKLLVFVHCCLLGLDSLQLPLYDLQVEDAVSLNPRVLEQELVSLRTTGIQLVIEVPHVRLDVFFGLLVSLVLFTLGFLKSDLIIHFLQKSILSLSLVNLKVSLLNLVTEV